MKNKIYIGLGSNLGNSLGNLVEAIQQLNNHAQIQVLRVAHLYLTEPVGFLDQPWFHNTVAEIQTELSPAEVLLVLQGIEHNLGRVRDVRWGPRTIDLDILLFADGRVINTPDLQVPHPRITQRAFVLEPLSELIPDFLLNGRTIKEWKQQLPDQKVLCKDAIIW